MRTLISFVAAYLFIGIVFLYVGVQSSIHVANATSRSLLGTTRSPMRLRECETAS